MPNEKEIIAVFKADIEQYKAAVTEMGTTNKKAEKSTDAVTASTERLSGHTKSAASSISTLSRGLGGITGLLGITGRLFGINTDKLEGFIFASREFIKVAKDVQHAQHLSNLATEEGTAAKVANEEATVSLTVAERILNAVRSAGLVGIGLLVAGVTALAGAVYAYVTSLKEEEEQNKKRIAGVKENIKLNNELTDSFNKRAKSEDEIALAEGVRTGKISQRLADELKLKSDALQRETEINDKFREKERLLSEEELNRASTTFLASENRLLTVREELALQKNKQLESIEADLGVSIKDLHEKFAKEDLEATKKANEKSEAEQQASLDKEFAAFVKYWDDIDKKNRDAQAEILKEQEQFEKNKQKLLEDEFVEEQDSAAKNRKEGHENTLKRLAEEKELNNKRIDAAKQVADIIFNAQQEAFDKRKDLQDKEISSTESNIEHQRRLAENGLNNTLAFEEKRLADQQRQQQKEAQAQKKIKLLETFLNSLAEYSKTDPKTALSKALLQVALATAASAVFAEEGGIIGEIGTLSGRRKHRGGGDVLLHAQTGEGILSRKEMDNLGKRNFHLLKDAARFPIRDDVFGMPRLVAAGGSAVSNGEVVKELKALQHIVKNKRETSYDINKFGEYINTTIENGITTVTKGKLKKPRFNA